MEDGRGWRDYTWVVATQRLFDVHPYLGKWSNLTHIFQMGWNQPPTRYRFFLSMLKVLLACGSKSIYPLLQTSKHLLRFGMPGAQKHTNKTPILKRYDWMSRVFWGWYLYKVSLIFCCQFAGFGGFQYQVFLGGVGLLFFLHPLACRPYAALNSPRRFGTRRYVACYFLKKWRKGVELQEKYQTRGTLDIARKVAVGQFLWQIA